VRVIGSFFSTKDGLHVNMSRRLYMNEKQCKKCDVVRPLTEFYPDLTHSDGVHSTCKACSKAISKAYREKHPEKMTQLKRAWKAADPIRHLLCQIKARCKRSNVPFAITKDDIELVSHCPALGIELDYNTTQTGRGMATSPNAASVDRIIPHLGYVPGNVQIISWRASRLKNDISIDEMDKMISYYQKLINR